MRRFLVFVLACVLGTSAFGQAQISLRSTDKAECVKSDYRCLQASFSFSGLETSEMNSERGVFSTLTMPNTVVGGNEGDPQIPVVSQLIAVPFGASPTIRVIRFSTQDYDLDEYGIHTLMPRQPDLRKDQQPDDVPFAYNEAADQTRGLRTEPLARVSVDGVMRGVQVGRMSIEPVSYDPVNRKIRVFNDIEVEVSFEGADVAATEEMLVKTYSPYFDVLYKQLFNGRAVRDVYDDHPDLWYAPVKMLVIANRMFESSIQNWVSWKTTKGIYVDVNYTDVIGTNADEIKAFIQNKFAQDSPTFLMIMGDKDQVAPSVASASETGCVSDLYYSSVDGDQFVDMYHSRLSATTPEQMTAMLNKALEYEQYNMPDPSYLNNALLIAGEDSGWGVTVGRPTIWYASNYYYNTEHGFSNVYEFSHGIYTNCYTYLNSGVGFANYTAHGSQTSWAGPQFTVNDVNNLTNTHKYFLAIGNCCQSGDWGYGTCFGEAMVRAENKGAYAYIGSCPNTYWLNDYYFGVGPTNRADGTMPSMSETGTGCYDAIWMDDVYNTVNSILYIGNLAGNAAQALGYSIHKSTLYYWQAYHVLGDGSIMPYRVQPTANVVSHMSILPIGMSTYEVSAVPGSYVANSKDGVIHGTALVDDSGTVQVPITPVTSNGDVTICVTAPQRIPYVATVPAAALNGAYISVDSFTPNAAHVGDDTNLSITFKNVGTAATTGNITITLTSEDPNVTVTQNTGSFGILASGSSTTVSGFQFNIASGVTDATNVTLHYSAADGDDIWEGNIVVTAEDAVLEFKKMIWEGSFVPGETIAVTARFKNTGHYQATNAVATMTAPSSYATISNPTINVGTLAVDQEVSCQFNVTISPSCPENAQIPVSFTLTADGGLSAQGSEVLKNSCNVFFELSDSYGDGWNGNKLIVSFDDGSPSQTLTIQTGGSANYTLEISNGVHVTLTWTSGSYASECSFKVSYEGDLLIYQSSGTPSAGVLHEFDCNCAAPYQMFIVTVTSSNTEQGTVSGGGEFSYGQICEIMATPEEGYLFSNWTQNGQVVSTSASYSFTVVNDVDLVANFVEGFLVGDGGDAINVYLPSYSLYNYTLSQQIYTAEELGSPGMIKSIAFYNGGTEMTRIYDLYMKPTEKSSFSGSLDWEVVTLSDKVFSGEVTLVPGEWTFFTFDTPFAFDGESNVVLVVDDNTGSWISGMSCRVFDAPSQAIRIYSDGINYDPFAPTSYSGTVMDVKNQIYLTKESFSGCMTPSRLTATEIGPDFVRLSWNENGDSEQWFVVYGGNFVLADSNEDFLLEGLEPETQYTIMVRPACDENLFSAPIVITTLEACPAPQNLEVGNITHSTATLSWTGYSDSYRVQIGSSPIVFEDDFDNGFSTDWNNNSELSWTIVDGHFQSGNAGVNNSSSEISIVLNFPVDGTIEFDAECRGEGATTYWDHCDFYIDGTRELYYGSNVSGWNHYVFEVSAGEHTFTWSYTKDGSVNPSGDYFAIDNVMMIAGESNWNDPITVDAAPYTVTGLNPTSNYCVRVQGVCGDTETEWSEAVTFSTTEVTIQSQTIALSLGWNWCSFNVDITLDDLKSALLEALPGTTISIKSQTQNTSYNPNNNRWVGSLAWDVAKMYMIKVVAPCEITFEGLPINPAEHPVSILNGANWIGFPLNSSMTLSNAFAGFAINGDKIKSQTNNALYNGIRWQGQLNALEPGKGYIYISNSSEGRVFTFPTSAK